jgi:hypothetical protein
MSPDKAQQLGNDLACLAASIAEIAEELKAMYDFGYRFILRIHWNGLIVRYAVGLMLYAYFLIVMPLFAL